MKSPPNPLHTHTVCGDNRAEVSGTDKSAKCLGPCYKRMKSAQAMEHSGCLTYPSLEHQEGLLEEVMPEVSLKREMGVGLGEKEQRTFRQGHRLSKGSEV